VKCLRLLQNGQEINTTQKLNDMVARSWAHHIDQMSFPIEPANGRTKIVGIGFPFWVPFANK